MNIKRQDQLIQLMTLSEELHNLRTNTGITAVRDIAKKIRDSLNGHSLTRVEAKTFIEASLDAFIYNPKATPRETVDWFNFGMRCASNCSDLTYITEEAIPYLLSEFKIHCEQLLKAGEFNYLIELTMAFKQGLEKIFSDSQNNSAEDFHWEEIVMPDL